MHDSMEIPANPDWIQGRKPLPILFASQVEHPEQGRFLQLIRKHQVAVNLLKHASLTDPEPVSELLDEIIAPVYALLKTVNVD
jgi:hypothetical protein